MKSCQESPCARKHYARGWCKYHYAQARNHGKLEDRPRTMVPRGATPIQRLEHHGWTITESGCWEFDGGRNPDDYGVLAVGDYRDGISHPQLAHRVAYSSWVGPIPDGQVVRHTCDNPPCINPAHLVPGTRLDNSADAIERGRLAGRDRLPGAKLTNSQVADIRGLYATGVVSQRAIAEDYGVSQQLISQLVRKQKRA